MTKRPVVFLSFANDQKGQFLEALRPEQTGIKLHLANYQNNSNGIVYSAESTELDKLLAGLNQFTGQLVIFHFSGHADAEGLQLEAFQNFILTSFTNH